MLTNLHLNVFRKISAKELRINYILIVIFAALALLAAFELSVDKIRTLENPGVQLNCNINSVLNCASVMKSPQAELLGFPNSFIGMMGFAVLLFFGLSGLMGVRYNKAVLRLLLAGGLAALIFAFWLFFESLYVIQILCPWCLLTTTSTTIAFGALLHISLRENVLNLSKHTNKKVQKWVDDGYTELVFASILVIGVILVVAQFGDALVS